MKTSTLFLFGTIVAGMSAYVGVMGAATNRASAIAIHDFSQDVITHWKRVATTLDVPLDKTKPGMLSPVVPETFGALDLIIYGHELVTSDFQEHYESLEMPRMVDRLHISTNKNNGALQYNVGGVQLIAIKNSGGHEGGAFYINIPEQLIDRASKMYDGKPKEGGRDHEGIVRYDQLDDGRYVMGIFLPYTQSAG